MTTSNEPKAMSEQEVKALYAEVDRKARVQSERADAVLLPYQDYICEHFTDRQAWRLHAALRRAFEAAEWFAKDQVVCQVRDFSRVTQGRKHSPRGVFSFSFDISVIGKDYAGAHGFFFIGKHGKVEGHIFEKGMCGRDIKLDGKP